MLVKLVQKMIDAKRPPTHGDSIMMKQVYQTLLDEYLTKERWLPHGYLDPDDYGKGCLIQQLCCCEDDYDLTHKEGYSFHHVVENMKDTLSLMGKTRDLVGYNDISKLEDVRRLVQQTLNRM